MRSYSSPGRPSPSLVATKGTEPTTPGGTQKSGSSPCASGTPSYDTSTRSPLPQIFRYQLPSLLTRRVMLKVGAAAASTLRSRPSTPGTFTQNSGSTKPKRMFQMNRSTSVDNKATPVDTGTPAKLRRHDANNTNTESYEILLFFFCVTELGGTLFALLAIAAMLMWLYPTPSYSVHLTGYEGIDPGRAARIVSPAFNVTLRMNGTACADTALVAVTYSDVALGWARAEPRDCAEGRWAKDLEVVARGGEVGLSRRLRDHMASDWRSGEVELGVTVMMYRLAGWRDTVGENIPRTFDGKVKMTREVTRTT
ncbi:hypothetical protein PAHAL_5G141400 [Panicum hallii]|uniref:Late embryogenesis abundant protein LEA-2 subgroup domain-containing protein n=1 Tax=Panicum hallii TaxID=206008 RepID=A0A2S3HRB1_9POAL|nr:hypothetical protein PAHAL_5G141400 [Panicum hallii]